MPAGDATCARVGQLTECAQLTKQNNAEDRNDPTLKVCILLLLGQIITCAKVQQGKISSAHHKADDAEDLDGLTVEHAAHGNS
jgi:hypothetical protein